MNASFNKGIIDIQTEAKCSDFEKVEAVAKILVEKFGYEEIAGDEDTIILEAPGSETVKEIRKDYREAKKLM